MSTTAAARPLRRVRHQARETAAVMVFSAVTSSVLAGALLLLVGLGR
jgi:hypothetical protein